MSKTIKYYGKSFTMEEIEEVREVITANQHKSRWFVSREICGKWDWTQRKKPKKPI